MASHQLTNRYQAISLTSDDSGSEQHVAQPKMMATELMHAAILCQQARPSLHLQWAFLTVNSVRTSLASHCQGEGRSILSLLLSLATQRPSLIPRLLWNMKPRERLVTPFGMLFHILVKCDLEGHT